MISYHEINTLVVQLFCIKKRSVAVLLATEIESQVLFVFTAQRVPVHIAFVAKAVVVIATVVKGVVQG
jgi:hypothetical protein